MAITKDQIIETLKQCYDPELLIDIWTLGLIYDIKITEQENKKEDNQENNKKEINKDKLSNNASNSANIEITMTFTFPGCPYGPMLVEDVTKRVKEIPGVKDVKVNIVFEPPWKPSDELRAMLGV